MKKLEDLHNLPEKDSESISKLKNIVGSFLISAFLLTNPSKASAEWVDPSHKLCIKVDDRKIKRFYTFSTNDRLLLCSTLTWRTYVVLPKSWAIWPIFWKKITNVERFLLPKRNSKDFEILDEFYKKTWYDAVYAYTTPFCTCTKDWKLVLKNTSNELKLKIQNIQEKINNNLKQFWKKIKEKIKSKSN